MMKIRGFEARDAKALCQMAQGLAAQHGDAAALMPEEAIALCGGSSPWFVTLVAETAGQLVGYACLLRVGQLHFGLRGLELHHLFVVPEERGNGIGAELVAACEALAREMGTHFLVVGTEAENFGAHRFYETQGFMQRPDRGPRFAKRL